MNLQGKFINFFIVKSLIFPTKKLKKNIYNDVYKKYNLYPTLKYLSI